MTAPTTREISDHAESPPSIAEIVEGEVRPHVSADHAELAAIISDEEIARVHGYASFGPSITPREVVNDGVRKYAVGYHSGYTQLTILLEHGLITRPRPGRYDANLTKKGKKYARVLYRREDALLSEIAALKGERRNIVSHATMGATDGEGLTVNAVSVEITRLRNAMHASYHTRATQAERQRDELRKALGTIGEMAPSTRETSLAHDMAQFASQALANQGADQ